MPTFQMAYSPRHYEFQLCLLQKFSEYRVTLRSTIGYDFPGGVGIEFFLRKNFIGTVVTISKP
jgi:hypothetical protein